MVKYFKNIESIHQFTLELERYSDSLNCHYCLKNDQFVSHGFVYKKQSRGEKRKVGKRIFCSNRSGRTGCGSTLRFYLSEELHAFHYNTSQLFIFLSSLIARLSIQAAYQQATGTREPRNAYRWLNRLQPKLIEYRRLLKRPTKSIELTFKSSTKRFQILLPTIQSLFLNLGFQPCSEYQIIKQMRFI